jgi:cysteine desulfurase/selenocysteine lyase
MPSPRSKTSKSANTMSTSESGKNAPHSSAGDFGTSTDFRTILPGESQVIPAGLPDPAILAQMANEFFTALPLSENSMADAQKFATVPGAPEAFGAARNPTSFVSLPGAASLPSTSLPTTTLPVATPPTESGLRGVPAASSAAPTIPGVATLPKFPSVSEFSVPGVPGGFSSADFSALSSFGFLDDIRPLFSYPAASPLPVAPSLPNVSIPDEAEFRAFADGFSSSATPQTPESIPHLATPQVPGATVQQRAPLAGSSSPFPFLDEIRQLGPATSIPAGDSAFRAPTQTLPALNLSAQGFQVEAIRRDFPILQERVHGKPLIWLDNAATTQKPQSVIDRLSHFYAHENSNIHRAAHELAARSTDAYEAARDKVRRFINAGSVREIIFVRGTTEAINLIARSWGRQNIHKDDEIVITWLEHHANIVPWQMLCAEAGARLRVAPVDNTGQVILDEYQKLLGPRTRLVAFPQVSNALGTVTPAQQMIEMAHRYGAKVLLDGAQSVSHMQTDVQVYDCDFFVFSGHKMFGPTGIGVVYGKEDILQNTQPWQGGGNMIQDVTFEKTTYQPAPGRFEAGTGNIADAVGLGAAVDYLDRIGMANIARYEHDLLLYATDALNRIPGLRLIGTAREKAGVLSFVLDGFRTEDVGAALNRQGIAVRAGHHCAQPILRRFGTETTVRPSLALYNTCEEIDALAAAIWNLKQGHSSL